MRACPFVLTRNSDLITGWWCMKWIRRLDPQSKLWQYWEIYSLNVYYIFEDFCQVRVIVGLSALLYSVLWGNDHHMFADNSLHYHSGYISIRAPEHVCQSQRKPHISINMDVIFIQGVFLTGTPPKNSVQKN